MLYILNSLLQLPLELLFCQTGHRDWLLRRKPHSKGDASLQNDLIQKHAYRMGHGNAHPIQDDFRLRFRFGFDASKYLGRLRHKNHHPLLL